MENKNLEEVVFERKKYSCDESSIQIQCGKSYITISNELGDGDYDVYLFNSSRDFENFIMSCGLRGSDFDITSVCYFNNAKILNRDCWEPGKTKKLGYVKETLFTLNGKYYVLVRYGNMFFVASEENKK